MATLSRSEIIRRYPIGKGLDSFRDSFNSACVELGCRGTPDAVQHFSNEARKNLTLDLFTAFQALPVAHVFPSSIGLGALRDDLFRVGSLVVVDDVEASSFIPLIEKVIEPAPDETILNTLSTLVTSRATPPRISNKLAFDTPFKSTSSSQQGSEQTHDEIDPRILQEINGCVYTGTKGFYEKYFEGKSWSRTAEEIVRTVDPQVVDGRWSEYPDLLSQNAFLEWFWTFQAQHFQGRRGTYYTSHSRPLSGSDWRRQPDLFLAPSGTSKRDGKYDWEDVRVIGELKQSENPKEYQEELVWFCGHAREVFKSQPTRRFLHGFFVCGSVVELWVLDRSGPYSCEKFDVHKDPNRFIRIMAGYALMSDEELGLNTWIKRDEIGKFIMFKGDDETREERLYLKDRPIAFQRAIVCRGTTCYRAKRQSSKLWEFVVKFSWRSDKRRTEGDFLKLAKARHVWGVAQLFGHQDLDRIINLRHGLEFGEPRIFRSALGNSFSGSQSEASGLLSERGISQHRRSSSSRPQRRRHGGASSTQAKRSRSESSRRRPDVTDNTTEEDGRPQEANQHNAEEPNAASLTGPTRPNCETFDNRILSCLVISPPGRPIREFKSVTEFLEACRDIIRALRSLYEDGRILHRDISENNLIITDAEKGGGRRGMVIDLDLAKELDSGPSGARHRTGTMEFMAIEVLEGTAHTYRHDLESFFYVFLWVIIRYGHITNTSRTAPEASRLRDWYTGTYDRIANAKQGHMDRKRFRGLLDEFPPKFHCLRELAEELRAVLFPIRDESLFTGTHRDPDKLYQPMIHALDTALAHNVAGELG